MVRPLCLHCPDCFINRSANSHLPENHSPDAWPNIEVVVMCDGYQCSKVSVIFFRNVKAIETMRKVDKFLLKPGLAILHVNYVGYFNNSHGMK